VAAPIPKPRPGRMIRRGVGGNSAGRPVLRAAPAAGRGLSAAGLAGARRTGRIWISSDVLIP
jgi:hypothetical protein